MVKILTNKKAFTLVELLIVIALLTFIIVIAIPSIVKIYNNVKLNAFLDEAKTIYNNIETSYNNDFMEETLKVDRYCDSQNSYIRKLRIEKPKELTYDIEIAENADVTKFYVINNTFQLLLAGNVSINDINSENVQKLDNFVYYCKGMYGIYCNVSNLPCIVVPSFQYNVTENNI